MNMSYCRFENTLADLEDCCGALEEGEQMSTREAIKAQRLYEVCQRYMTAYEEYLPVGDEDEEEC